MQLTNENQIEWTKKYYIVEGKTFYAGDTFNAMSAWTTKEEAINEKTRTMNLNPDNLRQGLRTRYRHRKLFGTDVWKLFEN